jgi:type I restriction enzyme, S subunit
MSTWRDTTLREVAELQRGFDITQAEQVEGPVPVVSSSGIHSFHDEAKAAAPGVVIGRKGTLGSVFYLDQPYWPHDTSLWVRDFHGNDPRFVYYFLKSLRLERFDSGGANPTLNRNHIHGLPVRVPDLATQRRIAGILSAYDALIDNHTRRMALLEESIHLLYREWFVRLRFPGHARARRRGGVPERWRRAAASELIAFSPATEVERGAERPYVPMEALVAGSMRIEGVETRAVRGGSRFKNGDTLLARITPCLENGKTGFVQFMAGEDEVATGSTELLVMRARGSSPYWVYCLARSGPFRSCAIASMAGADGRQRVRVDALERLELPVAPREVFAAFDERARPVFALVENLSRQNRLLAQARDALLPRLMEHRP